MLIDGGGSGGGEDLVIWETVEPLCPVLETILKVSVNETLT